MSGRERSPKRPKAETDFAMAALSGTRDRLLCDSYSTAHQVRSLFTVEAVVEVERFTGLIADVTQVRHDTLAKARTYVEVDTRSAPAFKNPS